MVMEGHGKNGTEDDAMLTKKYVGPVNCASCEKGIINLQGMPAEYLAWKRLPFREPQERIARVSFILLIRISTDKDFRRSSTWWSLAKRCARTVVQISTWTPQPMMGAITALTKITTSSLPWLWALRLDGLVTWWMKPIPSHQQRLMWTQIEMFHLILTLQVAIPTSKSDLKLRTRRATTTSCHPQQTYPASTRPKPILTENGIILKCVKLQNQVKIRVIRN